MNIKHKNNWLFFNHPVHCLLCLQDCIPGPPICSGCRADLPWLKHCCSRCALPLPESSSSNLLCSHCLRREPPFSALRAAFAYRFPIDQLIQQAKFNRQTHYLRLLGQLLAEKVRDEPRPDLLVPVPVHRKRLLEREYNQSAILARYVGSMLDIPVDYRLLEKVTDTAHQADLEKLQRQKNLRNSFRCTSEPPTSVCLIDDVVTTGATARELSNTLKRAGCQNLTVWTVARTGKNHTL